MFECKVPNCGNAAKSLGYCQMHYFRVRRNGEPGEATPRKGERRATCAVEGCNRPTVQRDSAMWCPMHRNRVRRDGEPGDALPRKQMNLGKLCGVEGCARPRETKGYCRMHYVRWRTSGSTGPVGRIKKLAGDGWIDRNGYRRLRVAGHRSVLEHRIVMEKILGRPLLPCENVHHINGVRHDNRPENLELWSSSQPSGQRVEDKIQWAINLLLMYQPGVLSDARQGSEPLHR